MPAQSGRYRAQLPGTLAAGWSVSRLTQPSRLNGANGIRTGKDGRIYVAQVAGSMISAINPDSGAIETISPIGGAITAPDDLAFDDEGNIYVTEITEGRVAMLAPDGTARIIHGNMPVANPITWHQGRLIAGECRMGSRIIELDRDGGSHRTILEDVPMANAFDVGPDGKLYVPVMATNEIWRVDLAGGAHEVVAGGLGVPDSVKFHPDGYIVSTQVHSGQVLRIDLQSGAQTVLADIGPGLDNVTFVGKRIFVSHITGSVQEIMAPGKVRALVEKGLQWPLGLAVNGDELFIADGGFTYTLGVEGAVREGAAPHLIGMLFSPGFPGWVRDVAAAGAGEYVVTTANGAVMRWWPGRQEHEVIASGYDLLMGVALAADGAVVFADLATGRVLSAKGGEVTELAHGLDRPMGVAICGDGAVYVAEAGAGRVVKLAAGKAECVIDGCGAPHGIVIAGGRLFVIDTASKALITCDLAGSGREIIAGGLPVGAPPGLIARPLGGVGDMCGPMRSFTGLAAGGDGTIYVAADAEGCVLAVRRS